MRTNELRHTNELKLPSLLLAEMKVNKENVPKPASNDELIENSDEVPIESHTPTDEIIKKRRHVSTSCGGRLEEDITFLMIQNIIFLKKKNLNVILK